jgi:hypothetical protein
VSENAVTKLPSRPQRQRKRPRRLEETDLPASINSDAPLGSTKASSCSTLPPRTHAVNKRRSPPRAQNDEKERVARKLHAALLKGRNLGGMRRNPGKQRVERPRWTADDIRLVKQSRLVSFWGGI